MSADAPTRGVAHATQRQIVLGLAQQAAPFVVWGGGIALILSVAFGFSYVRSARRLSALMNAPLKQALATVTDKDVTYHQGLQRRSYGVSLYRVVLFVEGRTMSATTGDFAKWNRTKVDSRVGVTYRQTPDGDYLVEDWKP